MHFHILQHVAFEGPAAIADWLADNDHSSTTTELFMGDALPSPETFDVLIVMGGPMSVDDTEQYPWLAEERVFIQQTIRSDKYILGICLGAQLIARACGVEVVKNRHKEIGWFDVHISEQELPPILHGVFDSDTEVFHWHGDAFEIPEGAVHFASSEACSNQGYILNDRVIGLQFHIETTRASAALLVENCRDELDDSTFVQSEAEILTDPARFSRVNRMLYSLLENMVLAQTQQ